MADGGLGTHFALDVARVGQLRSDQRLSADNPSLKEAAKQFEAMFTEQMLSSMRDAYLKSDLGRGPQTEFYESLMDKQWAQHVSSRGLGLAEQLVKQLTAAESFVEGNAPATGEAPAAGAATQESAPSADISSMLGKGRPR